MNKAAIIALLLCVSSFTGCIGEDDETSPTVTEDPCESDPWLFVMTGLNVTIDIEYEHDQLEVSKGADLLITNQNFSGPVTAYTEAETGKLGEVQVLKDHFGILYMLSVQSKNGAITGVLEDGTDVTVAFKLVNVTNSGAGTELHAKLIGIVDSDNNDVTPSNFRLETGAYLIDSAWNTACTIAIGAGVAAAIAGFCFVSAGSCVAEGAAVESAAAAIAGTTGFGEDAILTAIAAGAKSGVGGIMNAIFDLVCPA